MSQSQPEPPSGSEPPPPRLSRADLASWLSGPGAVRPPTRPDGTPWAYPGQRLGLPEQGPGSVARLGHRVVALVIDWFAALLLVRLFLPHLDYGSPASSFATMAVFATEVALFTWLAGSSFGQRLLGLQVVRMDGLGKPGLLRSLGRTVLLCAVIPPLVWDRDQRGLHDRLVGTVLLRGQPDPA